ncbi:MAG: DUF2813 domain-containing protein [Alphaproteobacteria bacterium]|nr:MAG: DUF2813 domain-containing protein [Alphaproteobacteria bacterium]
MAKHLESLYVKNFRCLDELTIDRLGDVNLLVGGNNSGKTTVLEALRVWCFRGDEAVFLLSERDEYHSEPRKDEDFLELVEHFFTDRRFNDHDDNRCIAIGETEDAKNLLKISDCYYYLSSTSHSNEGEESFTFKRHIVKKSEKKEIEKSQKLNHGVRASFQDDAVFLPMPPARLGYVYSKFIPTNTQDRFEFDHMLGHQEDEGNLTYIIDAMKMIYPPIEDVRSKTIALKNSSPEQKETIITVKTHGDPRYFPLKSMGEGVSRILQIALHAYGCKDGILLIDELENGLHYSIQEKVWEWLFELAKQYNMQIFATTHSKDVIEHFNNVAQAREEEGILISLGRSRSGKLASHTYSEESLDIHVTNGMEVRG